MKASIEKIIGSENSVSFLITELFAKQNITNTSSFFEKKIPNIDNKVRRTYF